MTPCRQPFGIAVVLRRLIPLLGLAAVCGCAEKPEPGQPKVNRDPNLLVIYSACAVAPTVNAARTRFMSENSGKSVEVVTDEPAKLAERVSSGAVPDVFVSIGATEIGALAGEGLLDGSSQQGFGELKVVIMVPKGNPAGIHEPDDLLDPKVKTIAIPAPGLTSAGSDAKRELERLRLWSKLQDKLSFRESPLAVLKEVSESKVTAALLYDPCIRLTAGDGIKPDSVEPASTLTAEGERGTHIHAVLHKQSPNALLAQRFLRTLSAQEHATTEPATQPPPEDAGAAK
jgi:ABC-type molybdate transport system substrate-binding protein